MKKIIHIKAHLSPMQREEFQKQWNAAMRQPYPAVICGHEINVIDIDRPKKPKFPVSLMTHSKRIIL